MISLLRDAGEALYGPRWQTDIARDLHVSDRTVRRWIAGSADLPLGVVTDLRRLCEARAADLDDLAESFRTRNNTGIQR